MMWESRACTECDEHAHVTYDLDGREVCGLCLLDSEFPWADRDRIEYWRAEGFRL